MVITHGMVMMNNNYPVGYIYEQLYARYFDKDVVKFIDTVNDNDAVLDLCGGTGILSKSASQKTKDITLVDISVLMSRSVLYDSLIKYIHMDVSEFLKENKKTFDVAFCRQAVNYWLTQDNLHLMYKFINKFVFNTFHEEPHNKSYTYLYNGKSYVEHVDYDRNTGIIRHIQQQGDLKHETSFRYIPEDIIDLWLSNAGYKIKKEKKEKSLFYIAYK